MEAESSASRPKRIKVEAFDCDVEIFAPGDDALRALSSPFFGSPRIPLRNFDETNQQYSDLVVVVGDQKFYVSKWLLAHHSEVFERMMGNAGFKEAGEKELKLDEWSPEEFQLFLETIMGEQCVDDTTVEKILGISDFLLCKAAMKRCQDFLVSSSKKSFQKKYELAVEYKFDDLKAVAISEVKTGDQLRVIIPKDYATTLDQPTMALFLQKSISLIPGGRRSF